MENLNSVLLIIGGIVIAVTWLICDLIKTIIRDTDELPNIYIKPITESDEDDELWKR